MEHFRDTDSRMFTDAYPKDPSLSPRDQLYEFATNLWGPQFDFHESGKARWGWVQDINGMSIDGCAVTNGEDYFTLDEEVQGVKKLDLTVDGHVCGQTQYYLSTITGKLVLGKRVVFW